MQRGRSEPEGPPNGRRKSCIAFPAFICVSAHNRLAIAAPACSHVHKNFDGPTPDFDAWGHGGVVKEQLRRLDLFFLKGVLGELVCLPVSLIIRPV